MIRLVKIELTKIFRKSRTYISFGGIAILVILIEASILIDGQGILNFLTQSLSGSFYFQGNLLNGYLISFVIINTLWIHIPLLIALVTGDIVASESNLGTFRIVLTRPVSRSSLLLAKFIAAIIYTCLVVIFLGVFSLTIGLALFNKGDLIVFTNKINILPENDLLWRFAAAYGFGILSMIVVAALSFLLSVFSNNSVGPIVGTLVIIIAFTIISTFEIPFFSKLRPFLFTTYLNSWRLFFEFDIKSAFIVKSIIHLFINALVFYLASLIIFNKRDILT